MKIDPVEHKTKPTKVYGDLLIIWLLAGTKFDTLQDKITGYGVSPMYHWDTQPREKSIS